MDDPSGDQVLLPSHTVHIGPTPPPPLAGEMKAFRWMPTLQALFLSLRVKSMPRRQKEKKRQTFLCTNKVDIRTYLCR